MKTVEAVTEGHPDKVCDQVADAILDAYLFRDPSARVAIEVMGSHGLMVISGEVLSEAQINIEEIARKTYTRIGYPNDIEILVNLQKPSRELSAIANLGQANDQGIMHGYATAETLEMLPRQYILAQKLAQGLADLRRHDVDFKWLLPDGKVQVTMDKNKPQTIVVSAQHAPTINVDDLRPQLLKALVTPLLALDHSPEILINPAGSFHDGGFSADTGLTGRKIAIDNYGPLLPVGGGSFSGKDATKIDRGGAYMCRFIAKNIVGNGLAKTCFVSLAYCIGREEPVMFTVKTDNGQDLTSLAKEKFDLRPLAIIERLELRQPIFERTACYGHFGRPGFPWEEIISL